MKILKTELTAKLNKIKGVVPRKHQMAVLQGILVKEGYLIANNLESELCVLSQGCVLEGF